MLLLGAALEGHAPPTPIPVPPLRVKSNFLVDSLGNGFLLRGVGLPPIESSTPTAFTFRVIQQRWNMNAVRIPVPIATWRRDGQPYLDRLLATVTTANSES